MAYWSNIVRNFAGRTGFFYEIVSFIQPETSQLLSSMGKFVCTILVVWQIFKKLLLTLLETIGIAAQQRSGIASVPGKDQNVGRLGG